MQDGRQTFELSCGCTVTHAILACGHAFASLSPPRWEVVALLALVVLACLTQHLCSPDDYAGHLGRVLVFALALLWTFGAQMSLVQNQHCFLS
jgi:hypothetical protein